jgi:tRNA threonylcarbamoyl adenosine modification protein YeaZ
MRLLAIDTALDACSTAVFDSKLGVVAGESLSMTRGHAEALLPQIARVMAKANLDFSDLDRIAVTIGPGSFTGLRVGVSAARGIALAAHKPAVGVTTLTALAMPLLVSDDSVPVVVAIDARHDQAYMQAFGAGGQALSAARIAPLDDAFDGVPDGAVRLVGSASPKVAALKLRETLVEDRNTPEIQWVATLGASASTETPPKPLYLRAPDAKPQQIGHLLQR